MPVGFADIYRKPKPPVGMATQPAAASPNPVTAMPLIEQAASPRSEGASVIPWDRVLDSYIRKSVEAGDGEGAFEMLTQSPQIVKAAHALSAPKIIQNYVEFRRNPSEQTLAKIYDSFPDGEDLPAGTTVDAKAGTINLGGHQTLSFDDVFDHYIAPVALDPENYASAVMSGIAEKAKKTEARAEKLEDYNRSRQDRLEDYNRSRQDRKEDRKEMASYTDTLVRGRQDDNRAASLVELARKLREDDVNHDNDPQDSGTYLRAAREMLDRAQATNTQGAQEAERVARGLAEAQSAGYASPEAVRDAFRSGKLTREEAKAAINRMSQ